VTLQAGCVVADPIRGNKIDRKAPEITLIQQTPDPSFSTLLVLRLEDAVGTRVPDTGGFGVAKCAIPVASGQDVPLGIGSNMTCVTAIDALGNVPSR
jgi:hypothetical protein